jgi:septal ring factor EnvC (AmiA/AmiB activator)
MIRTITIIILSICILGAAGWGAFSYNELQQQQRTIQQQDITIWELQQEREGFIDFVNELNTEMNGLLVKIWPMGEELKDIAVTELGPTGEKREYNYLECDSPESKLWKLGAGIEELIDEHQLAEDRLVEQQEMIEEAGQYFYQLEDEVQQLTAENEQYEQLLLQIQEEAEQAQTYEGLIDLLRLFLGWW